MRKSTAALVWLAGFVLALIFLPNKIPNAFITGALGGIVWTALIISMTKKTDGNKEKA